MDNKNLVQDFMSGVVGSTNKYANYNLIYIQGVDSHANYIVAKIIQYLSSNEGLSKDDAALLVDWEYDWYAGSTMGEYTIVHPNEVNENNLLEYGCNNNCELAEDAGILTCCVKPHYCVNRVHRKLILLGGTSKEDFDVIRKNDGIVLTVLSSEESQEQSSILNQFSNYDWKFVVKINYNKRQMISNVKKLMSKWKK